MNDDVSSMRTVSGKLTAGGLRASSLRASSLRAGGLRASSLRASSLRAGGLRASSLRASGLRPSSLRASSLRASSLRASSLRARRGALFLADFILHSCRGAAPHQGAPDAVDVRGRRVLEVASGVGLTSIVAAMAADSVVITDINRGNILRLIQLFTVVYNNDLMFTVVYNNDLMFTVVYNNDLMFTVVYNNDLMFTVVYNNDLMFTVVYNNDLMFTVVYNNDLMFTVVYNNDLMFTVVYNNDLMFTVVYNNDLTDAFFAAVHRLLSAPPCKTLLVALEKRYVFTTTEYDVVAPCYEYFLHRLDALTRDNPEAPASTCHGPLSRNISSTCPEAPASTCPEAPASTCPEAPASTCPGSRALHIHATCLDHASFPQYFVYDRTKELVLWTIRATLT
ncbi:uncharacterized protein LOC108669479 [Hyalella azteca]|uniref:Uncharacterized protein LOC108669479 n=1 Tax=Hyalella azteca TaxID=294128 RepID=A0A979FUJ2_HYAAZ|nr:uncharacterized protein LOC108669479 [Hyalella azteca]